MNMNIQFVHETTMHSAFARAHFTMIVPTMCGWIVQKYV